MAEALRPFPMSERKVFANNPLLEVVCELRFPTILRIEAELPAQFQDRVRHAFPRFEQQSLPTLPDIPQEVAKALGGMLPKPSFAFTTDAQDGKIVLTSENIAIVSYQYKDWENFKDSILLALNALTAIYNPSFIERVGLRYRNIIDRSKIGLVDTPWSELLNPIVAGELLEPGWSENISGVQKSIKCLIPPNNDQLQFIHGLGIANGSELSYILDFDYICTEKMEVADVDAVIERLHGYSGSAFQWAISDKLKLALD